MRISDKDFAAAVPFGFVSNESGTLVTIGVALRRRLGAEPGMQVDDVFEILRPARIKSFRELEQSNRATLLLRSRHDELELKGCTVPFDDGQLTAFWGGAVVRDIGEFKQRGLQVSDFPPSDATPDLLLSMQATRTALEDARQLGEQLKSALTKAEAATEAKARFLATMSHEIRTPLNGFGSMIDLLSDGDLTPSQQANLATMDECAHSLLVLVNDILEFSKLEAGKIQVSVEPVLVRQAITRMTEFFHASARERGIDLRVTIDIADEVCLAMDGDRVRQIASNLLGNALKFTQEGHVDLRAHMTAKNKLTVDVRDTGIGVPPEHQARLFEPFVQADASTTRRFGGTGLGLSISRQLARAMNGEVELVQSSERGSHFRMRITADPVAAPHSLTGCPTDTATQVRFAGKRVLVAEDDPTNQRIATRMLNKLGIDVTIAVDGALAVEAANAHGYDLILMDLMMPNMSGIDAANRIRSGDGPCKQIPIVAFSAAAMGHDREAAIEAGMSGFIEKPARLAGLRKALLQHLGAPTD